MRWYVIIGIIAIIGIAGWFVYLNHNFFEKSVTGGNPSAEVNVSQKSQTESVVLQDTVKENTVKETSSESPISENIKDIKPVSIKPKEEHSSEVTEADNDKESTPETEKPSEMSAEEIKKIVDKAMSFEVDPSERDDVAQQLEEALSAKFGPDEQIPRFVDLWVNASLIIDMAEKAENAEDVAPIIDQLPSIVLGEMVEIALDLTDATPEQAAEGRAYVDELKKEVDSLVILESVIPLAKEAIRAGDISTKEAEAFIKEVSGHDVELTIIKE